MSTKLLLVDDHKIMRHGIRSLLEKEAGMEVLEETNNGRTAIELARNLSPDVVIMDIAMHDLNGVEATRQITTELPEVKVIMLSMHSDRQMVADALLDCSNRGGIVLDCFGGSGTTLIAAEKTGRRARLIELDPRYVDVTLRRYKALI